MFTVYKIAFTDQMMGKASALSVVAFIVISKNIEAGTVKPQCIHEGGDHTALRHIDVRPYKAYHNC